MKSFFSAILNIHQLQDEFLERRVQDQLLLKACATRDDQPLQPERCHVVHGELIDLSQIVKSGLSQQLDNAPAK